MLLEVVATGRDGAQDGFGEGTPDDRRELQGSSGSLVERVEPRSYQRLQGGRDREVVLGIGSLFDDGGCQFLDEQRVALRPLDDLPSNSGRTVTFGQQFVDPRAALLSRCA